MKRIEIKEIPKNKENINNYYENCIIYNFQKLYSCLQFINDKQILKQLLQFLIINIYKQYYSEINFNQALQEQLQGLKQINEQYYNIFLNLYSKCSINQKNKLQIFPVNLNKVSINKKQITENTNQFLKNKILKIFCQKYFIQQNTNSKYTFKSYKIKNNKQKYNLYSQQQLLFFQLNKDSFLKIRFQGSPYFLSTPKTKIKVNHNYVYDIRVYDYNKDQLTISLIQKPQWLNFYYDDDKKPNLALLEGRPNQPDVGYHEVILQVSDNINSPVQQKFLIEVFQSVSGEYYDI